MKCGPPHLFCFKLKTVGWCQTKDGLLGPNAELGLKNVALKVQSHTAGFLSSHKMFQNGLCGFMHTDKGD